MTTVAFGAEGAPAAFAPVDALLACVGFGAALRVPEVGGVVDLLRLFVVFDRLEVLVLLRVLILASICCSIGVSLS
ncbi:hypothetical protein FDP25_00475 [Roseovarius sp. A21]|uniref:Uncharacterized protein n=1 Tax=Roseovarius bejariae TaxID=2576383 RepID=A0A844CPM2_9RHOB|nr:hypothetical protein [Roseovarius bejariae]MRU13899.1 hypothetical protein [Roseovarius bejariae]